MAHVIQAEWEKPFSFRQAFEEAQAKAKEAHEERTLTLADLEKMFSDMPTIEEQFALFLYDPPGKIPDDPTAFKYYIMCEASSAPHSDHYDIHYRFREKIGQLPYSVIVRVPRYEVAGSTLRAIMHTYAGQLAIPAWFKEMGWDQTTTTS